MWIRIRAVHDSGSALDSMRIWILDVENLLKTGIFFISTVIGYDTYITVQYRSYIVVSIEYSRAALPCVAGAI